jgi:hypothetical protein
MILGIDPGKKPTLVVLSATGELMEHKYRCSLDEATDWIDAHHIRLDAVGIEKVSSLPGDGHVGAFTFGYSYGYLRGVLAALLSPDIPVYELTPQTWKSQYGLIRQPKSAACDLCANRFFPAVKGIFRGLRGSYRHDTADAALIARLVFLMHYDV